MSKRPSKVTVMGVPFRVEWDHEFEESATLGDTNGGERLIRIAPHRGREGEIGSTFMHELMHAVLYVSGLERTLEKHQADLDETVVHVLEHGIHPLLATIKSVS